MNTRNGLCLPLRRLAVPWWPLQLGLDVLLQHPLHAPSSPVQQDVTSYVACSWKRLSPLSTTGLDKLQDNVSSRTVLNVTVRLAQVCACRLTQAAHLVDELPINTSD